MRTNVLLLQGPVGPFFKRLSEEFQRSGHTVYKVNFNGGDAAFYGGERVFNFQGEVDSWAEFLRSLISSLDIKRIYVFGDCRVYHQIAREVAEAESLRFFVFEEGYIRPDFITLEESGVNGHTKMQFSPSGNVYKLRCYRRQLNQYKNVFVNTAWYACRYYLASVLQQHRFKHYVHHRPLNIHSESINWLTAGVRKLRHYVAGKRTEHLLTAQFRQKYFLVPLQVHNDMQITMHSGFSSVSQFIEYVMRSFSAKAPEDIQLVIKHHPLDRAYRNYTAMISQLAKQLGIEGRVHYVFDSHLPSLLRAAKGTVTINSTVGLSSLLHGVPVKTLGHAIYDIEGLTASCALDEFWGKPGEVSAELFFEFREFLLENNQLNGNFYSNQSLNQSPTGIRWSNHLYNEHFLGRKHQEREKVFRPMLIKNSAA
jgi:capsular polysaccharide export protein